MALIVVAILLLLLAAILVAGARYYGAQLRASRTVIVAGGDAPVQVPAPSAKTTRG